MAQTLLRHETDSPWIRAAHARVELRTQKPFQLIDLTALVAERVRRSGVWLGTASLQTLHTTTAVFLNEAEPRLLEDVEAFLDELVPRERACRHDELEQRTGPMALDERRNGHAHLRALLLPPSVSLNVVGGELALGRWQSVLLAELDGPRERTLSLVVAGVGERR